MVQYRPQKLVLRCRWLQRYCWTGVVAAVDHLLTDTDKDGQTDIFAFLQQVWDEKAVNLTHDKLRAPSLTSVLSSHSHNMTLQPWEHVSYCMSCIVHRAVIKYSTYQIHPGGPWPQQSFSSSSSSSFIYTVLYHKHVSHDLSRKTSNKSTSILGQNATIYIFFCPVQGKKGRFTNFLGLGTSEM